MIELLYTFLVLFGIFFPFFLACAFQVTKIIFIFFQLILSFILLSKNFYRKHDLFNSPRFHYLQSTNFNPIISICDTYYKNGTFAKIKIVTKSNEFSLIETEKYKTQCSENYFVESIESCPITDIKLQNEKNNLYENYIEINNNEYLYYTKHNKTGKLYK